MGARGGGRRGHPGDRRNPLFLSDFTIPEKVRVTGELADAVAGARAIVFVVPVQFARGVLRDLRPHLPADAVLVSASKGIEVASLARMDELVRTELGLPEGSVRGALGSVVRPRGGDGTTHRRCAGGDERRRPS